MSSERAPRVLLGGWYGAANLGDELVFATFVRWLREAGAQPQAISVHPQLTEREFGVPAVGYGDLPAIVEAMALADRFVLGGGGLFQDYEPFDRASLARFPAYNVAQFAQFARLATELGVPVAVLAQGVGPLAGTEARAIAAEVFTLADAVSLRDQASAAALRDLGVARETLVAPDPGWTYRSVPRATLEHFPSLRGRSVLAVVVRDWPFDRRWEEPFVAALADALPPSWACLWLDFARLPDATGEGAANDEIAGRLAARLPGRVHAVWRGMRLDEAAGLIAACDAAVAMRLHAVLLAHGAGLPVIALEYDDKVRALGDDAGAPPSMRMPLADVAQRLPAALALVASGAAPALASDRREELATRALAHRDLLLRSLACPAAPARTDLPDLLPGWLEGLAAEGRARVDAALARRRGRSGCA
jgi:polysaccharide pyruvyl transferase CsaB